MIVVSIGLIRARIPNALLIVKDLMSGSLKPDKIIFCVSKEPYSLDKGIEPNELPKINESKVEFKYVENFGPIRRIAPIVEEYYNKPETKIILFDDDRKPGRDTVQKLVEYSNKHPNVAVGATGIIYKGDRSKYKKLGVIYQHHHSKELIDGIVLGWVMRKPIEVSVIVPCTGLLVKPKFFSEDFFKWMDCYDNEKLGISYTDQSFINFSLIKNKIKRIVIPLGYVPEYPQYIPSGRGGKIGFYKIAQLKEWKEKWFVLK